MLLSQTLGFWGLVVEPGKEYKQTVEIPFRLTMAALDVKHVDGEPSCVLAKVDDNKFTLCTLRSPQVYQQPFDLVFTENTVVSFEVTGKSKVHLTGHYLPDVDDSEFLDGTDDEDDYNFDSEEEYSDDEDLDDSENDYDDEEEEDDDDLVPASKRIPNGRATVKTLEDDDDDEDDDDYEEMEIDEDELEAEESFDSDDIEDEDEEEDEDEDEEEDEEEEEEEEEEEDEEDEQVNNKRPASQTSTPQSSKKAKVEEIKITTPKSAAPSPANKSATTSPATQNTSPAPKMKTLPSGLTIEDITVGKGPRANQNSICKVAYTGTLPDGKVFDSGKGFPFTLGRGEVIKGWDMGVQGMLVGGERKLIIPAKLAYGEKGAPPKIPKNATLHFTIKLLEVKGKNQPAKQENKKK